MCCYQDIFLINKGLSIWLVTFPLLDIFYGQTINNHHQLRVVKGNTPDRRIVPGEFKSPFFQAFVVQDKTNPLPVQQLDLVTALIDKYKNIPTAGVAPKLVLYKAGKTVKTFSHIGGLAV
jgi:hypothetical protein